MEFDRSQIFAPVTEDAVPRFAQRPRPAAPGLLDQLPSTNIGRTKNNDRLRILVRGVPDHVTSEEVEKLLINPFEDIVDSWYLVRQDFVADLDLDLDHEDSGKSCTRVYVQLHDRESVQRFHTKVNGNYDIANKWSKNPDDKSDTETISDIIPLPLHVEYSPLSYFAPDPATTEAMAGTIESDPLYIKFCENPDQLLFEGGEGRVLEPVVAPTEFEVDSIVPVGVPLAKIEIPEDERVTLPEEKKGNKKKSKKGSKKENEKDNKPEKTNDASQGAKQKEKESTVAPNSREATPSDDKKKKRSRKKKATGEDGTAAVSSATAGAARASAVLGSSDLEASTPLSATGPAANNTSANKAVQGKSKAKKKKARDPKDSNDTSRESPTPRETSREPPAPRESRESTPKESRDAPPAAARKPKKKSAKPKKDPKAEAKADSKLEPKTKQQPGKENQPKPKPKAQPQLAVPSVTQATNQSAGSQSSAEKVAPPKKKRTRSKKTAPNGTATAPATSSSTPQ
ncbi:hypothetical protein CJU90_3683 [Yarrowia sp. C11]|nr:hypothetical protein CKK34_5293 [Yarrowia sp. E02]KAG5367389.1 hypothetical protein CJU90_3683 [Yarrowia sp. C11]